MKSKHRANHLLYILLLAISIYTIVFTNNILNANEHNILASILLNIGCGATASVIVAWLIDISNNRARNYKLVEDRNIILLELKLCLYIYLHSYISAITDEYAKQKSFKGKWILWEKKLITLIKKGKVSKEHYRNIIERGERVIQELESILKGKAIYISANIINDDEYVKLLELRTSLKLINFEIERNNKKHSILVNSIKEVSKIIENFEGISFLVEQDLNDSLDLLQSYHFRENSNIIDKILIKVLRKSRK